MSYINKQSTTLVRVKLTDIGREQLAKGQLTFTNYIIGDSEVDYNYVKGWKEFVPSAGAATGQFYFTNPDGTIQKNIFSKVLRPKDDNPFFSTFLLNQSNQFLFPLNQQSNIQLIKGLVSNKAEDRGFFSGSTVDTGLIAQSDTNFIKESGTINLGKFNGNIDLSTYTQGVLVLDTPLTATSVNDYIVFRFSNPTLGNVTGDTMTAATINTTYSITYLNGSTIRVDRTLPTLSAYSGTIITYYTIPGGDEPTDSYYGFNSLTAYWYTGTLSFESSCDICVENIPVWNMNNVWTENPAGLYRDSPINFHEHNLFGSEQYTGTKQYLGYNENLVCDTNDANSICGVNESISYIDPYRKSISIIHYTNSCISNFYGEQFYIDAETGKLLNLDIPVMWHRRNDVGTSSGTTLGMRFTSDGVKKTLSSNNDVEYYDLIEFSGMSVTPTLPLVVGKVFPQLQIVVIDNEELIAAMSYRSNRNYTLPDLSAELVTSVSGNCTGVLKAGERMYLTYWLENVGTGTTNITTPILPSQRYSVIDNNTSSDKDVQFRINNIGQLPYMRKKEDVSYDGYGFFADTFKVLAQVVDPNTQFRPIPSNWKVMDFTSNKITVNSGETINPLLFENQNPNITGFIMTGSLYSGASIFNLGSELDMPNASYYNRLNFGKERLFYGNLRTYIGATIYKSLFNINVDGASISSSSNPSYDFGDDRYISEIGILDNSQNLVLVGKLSRPIRLANTTTASIELTIDF